MSMPDHAAMERYLGRCTGLVVRLQGMLPATDLDHAQHLIDHGEAPEGMLALAWSIVRHEARVPAEVLNDIRELAADLVPEDAFPPSLDDFASA